MSSIDHSCDPNCVIIFNGIKASIKVLRDIKTNEQVRRFLFLIKIF